MKAEDALHAVISDQVASLHVQQSQGPSAGGRQQLQDTARAVVPAWHSRLAIIALFIMVSLYSISLKY